MEQEQEQDGGVNMEQEQEQDGRSRTAEPPVNMEPAYV